MPERRCGGKGGGSSRRPNLTSAGSAGVVQHFPDVAVRIGEVAGTNAWSSWPSTRRLAAGPGLRPASLTWASGPTFSLPRSERRPDALDRPLADSRRPPKAGLARCKTRSCFALNRSVTTVASSARVQGEIRADHSPARMHR
jgi:hypothetical protein